MNKSISLKLGLENNINHIKNSRFFLTCYQNFNNKRITYSNLIIFIFLIKIKYINLYKC